ncbi:unnamed protein product [Aphanomyces euteiches]
MASLFLLPPAHMKVVARVRPMLRGETAKGSGSCVNIIVGGTTASKNIQIDDHLFQVDRVYDERVSQRDIFHKELGNKIADLFEGHDVTAFACGAPTSGKSFTMEGSAKSPGLIPRAMVKLFQVGKEQVADFRVEVALHEIYQHKVLDLLAAKANQDDVSVCATSDDRLVLQGLTSKHIGSNDDFIALYERACKRRRGTTSYHSRGNRSHFVLQVRVESRGFDGLVRSGCLHMMDLASQDDICPTAQESASMLLGMQPYDESLVSRILVDRVTNSNLALMICTISPARSLLKDTLEALQHAAKKKQVVGTTPLSSFELTPKAKSSKSPTLDTTAPWSKKRCDCGSGMVAMKKLKFQDDEKLTGDAVGCSQAIAKPRTSHGGDSNPSVSKGSIKHILTMAMDYEKRGKGRTAIALYMVARDLLDEPNTKLEARIQELAQSFPPTPCNFTTSASLTVKSRVQTILEADVLHTLNHGPKSMLLEFQGIGEKKAAKILAGRADIKYASMNDLIKAGMGEKQVTQFHQLNVESQLRLL